MNDRERRQASRIGRPFMVRYRVAAAGPLSWGMSPLHDLSAGGARFVAEETFAIGDELRLELLLPVSKEPIAVTARVTWTKPSPLALSEYGVAFELKDEHARQVITEAVIHFAKRGQET